MRFIECGTLPIGVAYQDRLHREYKLRPLTVKESMAARRSEEFARCEGDDEMAGLLVFSRRLEIDGIPREAMTLDLMLGMFDDDLNEVMTADGRLKEQIARFRGQDAQTVDAGPGENRDALGKGRGDGAGAGPGVAGGLGGPATAAGKKGAHL